MTAGTVVTEDAPVLSSSSSSLLPLDVKIIQIIKSCPNYTIRPARLATELSITVGGGPDGASFTFEEQQQQQQQQQQAAEINAEPTTSLPRLPPVMVFTFPLDFEQRAWRYRRREDTRDALLRLAQFGVKWIQILTALGLILSISIVTVAAMVGFMVAAFLLLSRGVRDDSNGHRLTLMRQIRWWWSAVRQFLWCYALLGPGDQHHSLLRDIAMDIAMFGSMCNPRNIWFWFRVRHWCQRRQQEQLHRGWRRLTASSSLDTNQGVDNNSEGVRLLPQDTSSGWAVTPEVQYRGLLSVAVEFLFGPSPFSPGPSESDKWKLRAAVIVERSSASQGVGVALEELVPYVDSPPDSMQDIAGVVATTLPIVAHFHGIPARRGGDESNYNGESNNAKAKFFFSELLAETEVVGTHLISPCYDDDDDDGTLETLFYATEPTVTRGEHPLSLSEPSSIPTFLQERRYRFTKLQMNQFFLCCFLLVGNLMGVAWLQQSLQPGGFLSLRRPTLLFRSFRRTLVPLLFDYALVFIILPCLRLAVVMVLNAFILQRNQRRYALAATLSATRSNQDDDMRRSSHQSTDI